MVGAASWGFKDNLVGVVGEDEIFNLDRGVVTIFNSDGGEVVLSLVSSEKQGSIFVGISAEREMVDHSGHPIAGEVEEVGGSFKLAVGL